MDRLQAAGGGCRPGTRAGRAVASFAVIVCPPELTSRRRVQPLLAEFGLMAGAMPPRVRRALGAAFVALNQGARLYPPSRGRCLARLDDGTARAYVRALLAGRGGMAEAARRLRSLVVMCYYELPEVRDELGYRPDPYIAAVSRRRQARYAAEIRAGEAAVTAPGPERP